MKKKRKTTFTTTLQTLSGEGPKLPMMAELAAKISNDISEGYDGKESRQTLRKVIAWWAGENCRLHMERSGNRAEILWAKLAITLMRDAVLRKDLSKRRATQIAKCVTGILDALDGPTGEKSAPPRPTQIKASESDSNR